MVEVQGDFWKYPAHIKCITTNATRKKDRSIVMGRGLALECARFYPCAPYLLFDRIHHRGNVVSRLFTEHGIQYYSFPVKQNYWEKASVDLIKASLEQIREIAGKSEVLLPRVGCGNGGLSWVDVKPICEYLPDNFKFITYERD